MDAVKFLKKYHKLCDPRSCDDCPLLKRVDGFKTCLAGERNGYEERVVEIVEKWSKEQENKMTKAEAIELLVNATYSEEWQGNEKLTKAQHMAIEALEREPSEDCISRQNTLDALYDKGSSMTAWGEVLAMKWSDIQKCIEQLPSAEQKHGKWIPVTESLPEEGLTVLIFTEVGDIELGQRLDNKWEWLAESISDYWTVSERVIAWQPLPEPYEETEQ